MVLSKKYELVSRKPINSLEMRPDLLPYLGFGLSHENIKISESDNGTNTPMATHITFSPNIVFGWDIRPSVKGDWWILRTNLRYFPFLDFDRHGKTVEFAAFGI